MSMDIRKGKCAWRILFWVFVIVLVIVLFCRALKRTIPGTLPQIDEEILRMTISGIYEPAFTEADSIMLYETGRERDMALNRDYYEYDYRYIRPAGSYAGHLTACYEYDGKEWRLVSIGITDLKQIESGREQK